MYGRIGDGRRQAPVRHALELLDAHLLAELCVGHDDQWLPSHVKSAGRSIESKLFAFDVIGRIFKIIISREDKFDF
jgi:hypothetical protein